MDSLKDKADKIGRSKTDLRRRLVGAKACLHTCYASHFDTWTFDFENKCLMGDGFVLQWINDGKSSAGSVVLFELEKTV